MDLTSSSAKVVYSISDGHPDQPASYFSSSILFKRLCQVFEPLLGGCGGSELAPRSC